MKRPLLVGEINGRTDNSALDLYPLPPTAAGGRLCKLLGITSRQYLHTFDRVNLCHNHWNMTDAKILAKLVDLNRPAVILLGRKVAAAFGMAGPAQFTKTAVAVGKRGTVIYTIPHPSGRNRVWDDPANVTRLRRLLSPLLREARKA
jgi:hypothetical protein